MRITFNYTASKLKEYSNRFDAVSNEAKLQCLHHLASMPLTINQKLINYFETLLFILAYPTDSIQRSLAEKEILRITRYLKKIPPSNKKLFENSGMPFTDTVARFSHDGVRWLLTQSHSTTTLHSFDHPSLQLNDVLKLTLTSLEKSETTAGRNNEELMDVLLVPQKQRLSFLIHEIARLDSIPFIKDQLYDGLKLLVKVRPKNPFFSKGYNRIPSISSFFHEELIKKFDIQDLMNRPLPAVALVSDKDKNDIITVVKNAMVLTKRETDPTTFMNEDSFRIYQLERGISIAIYDMIPSRQLPLESYVGFTAFKNGFPASYGGAWVFGERANFGMNIFESFRKGESGFIMAQLLRVYKLVFNLTYFEVEAYQFGLDNQEGIESGAYWFYYRYGFRSIDKQLKLVAEKELEKINAKKGYRTSHKTLIEFTGSNIGLKLGKNIPPNVADITFKVSRMIQSSYKGNRLVAETACRQKFLEKAGMLATLSVQENQVLTEVALWVEALKISASKKLNILTEMIKTKPTDVYSYQVLIRRFFTT